MINIADAFFSTEKGSRIYNDAVKAIDDYSMREKMRSGVILGFSGGADSLALLLFLIKYKNCEFDFPLLAVHINHMIRGEEADADERFAHDICERIGVPFVSFKINVPKLAIENKLGTEEAARNARYEKFRQLAFEYGYTSIAVAHNATDNLETVILNMMRGAGTSGIAGIMPVRDNVIRPLIYTPKDEIVAAFRESQIDFKEDSTNFSLEYSRNYVRHKIIPLFAHLAPSPERMTTRMSHNLREDGEFIDSVASDFYLQKSTDGVFSSVELAKLSRAILRRVITKMVTSANLTRINTLPERTHVESIFSLLKNGDFRYSLPGGVRFVSKNGKAYIEKDSPEEEISFTFPVEEGINRFEGFSSVLLISKDKNFESYSNIYKISIQAKITSAIINGNLYIRSKKDGDSYFYGGMNRKLKKLFNDKKISVEDRRRIPILCDSKGIVWVAGFGVRDDSAGTEPLYVAFAEPITKANTNDVSFYLNNMKARFKERHGDT